MVTLMRLRHELVELPKVGEEFDARPGETAVGSMLVEDIQKVTRNGEKIIYIIGFG